MKSRVIVELDESGCAYVELELPCITVPGLGADVADALREALANADLLFESGCDCAVVCPDILLN